MSKMISIDEYLSKRSLSAHDGQIFRAASLPQSFSAESRSAQFVMTDETPDSYGDIVKAKGAKLDRFANNPIALRNHRSTDVIGRWLDVKQSGSSVVGTCKLADAGTSPLVDETFKLMAQGILKAASIGFMPLEIEMMTDKDGKALYEYIIHTWDLYECSVVSIPANPNALAKAIKEGDRSCLDHIEEILDTYTKASGLIVPRAAFEETRIKGLGERKSFTFQIAVDENGKFTVKDAPDVTIETAPAPDPILVSLETGFEKTVADLETELKEIPEAESDRKDLLSRMIDGIRGMFKDTSKVPETKEVKEPEAAPVLATEDEKQALRRKLLEFEAEDLAA